MKFNEKFKATYKVRKVISDRLLMVRITDTGKYRSEVKDCCISGIFNSAYENDVFESECWFEKDEKNGYILRTDEIPFKKIPAKENDLAKFAASQIKGVSKEAMMKVIDALGIDFIGRINMDPLEIEKTAVKESQRDGIVKWCEAHYDFYEISGNAYIKGLSQNELNRIFTAYGSRIARILEYEPYTLYIHGFTDFAKTDRIAMKSGIDPKGMPRAAAVVYHLIEMNESEGSMAISKKELNRRLEKSRYGFPAATIWEATEFLEKENIIGKVQFDETGDDDSENIYYGKYDSLRAERFIADYIKEVRNKRGYPKKKIEESLKGNELNKEQRKAAIGCLGRKISILSGGPGTGKTYTIKRIIRTAKNINPDIRIALMAPTGKAASRMIEMVGLTATTIHAALGISEGDNLIDKDGMKLEKDLIIIDESSMIDEKLFSYFCRHINRDCQVILVGDTGQLPSVEAGNLLAELQKLVKVYELTTICRQDKESPVVTNAHRIRNGKFSEVVFDEKDFRFIETDDIVGTADSIYAELIKEKKDPEEIMILSPQHNREGSEQINLRIQERNPGEEIVKHNTSVFKTGDRVIQTKNVKKLDIHNGDQGRVTGTCEKGVTVMFDGKDDEIEITDLSSLELAYAITVHKSQGSEADTVIMIFNRPHMFTLSRRLVYTALTRTKRKFIGIGSKEVFYEGCGKEDVSRVSLIEKYVGKYDALENDQDDSPTEETENNWYDWINN